MLLQNSTVIVKIPSLEIYIIILFFIMFSFLIF